MSAASSPATSSCPTSPPPATGCSPRCRCSRSWCEQGRPASEACRIFERLPQQLKNVRFAGASPLLDRGVQAAITAAEAQLRGTGRVLIRESGTEPLVRVMAEGEDSATVTTVVDSLCELIAEVAARDKSAAAD